MPDSLEKKKGVSPEPKKKNSGRKKKYLGGGGKTVLRPFFLATSRKEEDLKKKVEHRGVRVREVSTKGGKDCPSGLSRKRLTFLQGKGRRDMDGKNLVKEKM